MDSLHAVPSPLVLEPDPLPDPEVHCDRCAALCCRLTVVLEETDRVPDAFTRRLESGHRAMRQNAAGWCVALGADHRCSIYAERPRPCRAFVMGGPYCCAVREDAARDQRRGIASVLDFG